MSLLCALLILIAGHTTARWLYQHLTSNQPYKLRWTFQGLLVIALMFAAGMGATGIAHQTGWLFHDGHLYTYGFRTQLAYQAKCATNMRQLGTCLQLFATAHNNHLPDDLTELADYDIDPDVFVCRASDDTKAEGATTQQWVANLKTPGSRHCSYIYLGKGLTWPVPAETPLLTESLSNHDDKGMNVLFGDGHVEFIEPDQIKSLRFPP
jgi:prepilin-type processing-associated H-X9-DG protein